MTSANSIASRCAVLVAIPATREEFDAAMSHRPLPDYFVEKFPDAVDPSVKWEQYKKTANAAQALIATARELKAGVYEQATLDSLTNATAEYQYVIVCAHWRGAFLRTTDLASNNLEIIFERIGQHATLASVQPQNCTKEEVVTALNAAIRNLCLPDSLPKSILEMAKRTPAIGRVLSRDFIDKVLNGYIALGNCVELSDGLHTPAEFEAALWSGFAGELDLALCTSVALATFLDLRRANRVANLYWDCEVDPVPQLKKIARTLEIMASNGGGYIETRLSVEEEELRDGS